MATYVVAMRNRLGWSQKDTLVKRKMSKEHDSVRRTILLCDNDVGARIDAIGEPSSARLGNRRLTRDGPILYPGPCPCYTRLGLWHTEKFQQ